MFAYFLLGRLEQFLEAGQPEEQYGFRPGRRLEEHLVTANLVLDKADAVGIPVWIISLDLSKAFDRVHWLTPSNIIASYKTFRVVIRDQGKLMPVAFVGRNLGLEWLDASAVVDGVREAMDAFIQDLE